MSIRQLYYTSAKHPQTNVGGFQAIAATPNMPRDERNILNGMMSYAIPPHLQQADIASHPVALRYMAIDGRRGALVCSQSVGTDENSRPGNYFAHALVGDVNDLTRGETIPPITHWGSTFWQREHTTADLDLPELTGLTSNAAFDYEAVFDFMKSGQRTKLLRSMLSAIAGGQSRIILKDTPDNIVQWIYAVSLALPSRLRSFLSFSTYSHDPQNSIFLLTGILPEQMVAGPHWLLDGLNQTAPTMPAASWGDFVTAYFTEAEYPNEVLPLLDWMNVRLRTVTTIPATLNAITDFERAARKGTLNADWPVIVAGVQAVADTIPQQAQPQDQRDVEKGIDLLMQALKATPDEGLVRPLSQLALSMKSVTPPLVAQALVIAVNMGLRPIAKRIAHLLQEVGGTASLASDAVLAAVDITTADSATLFWELIAPHANLTTADVNTIRAVAHPSLRTHDESVAAGGPAAEQAERLLTLMAAIMREQPKMLLPLISEYKLDHPDNTAFDRLYYAAVEKLTPQQRLQDYWRVYWDQFDHLAITELRFDLRNKRSTDDKADRLLEWLNAMEANWRRDMLDVALAELWPDVDRQRFGNRLIAEPIARANLKADWYKQLLEAALLTALIDFPDQRTQQDYESFEQEVPIGPIYAAVFEGSLALARKNLHYEVAGHIYERFVQLQDAGIYAHEANRLMETFLPLGHAQHLQLIRATFASNWRDTFWELYGEAVRRLLLDAGNAEQTAIVLDFWFRHAAELYTERPFVVPEFFLQLPGLLTSLRSDRAYKRVEQAFENACVPMPWYHVIGEIFSKGRRGRLGGLLG